MKYSLFGFLALAGTLAAAGVPAAEATTVTTVVTADFAITGTLDGQQTVTIPGFSGPGALTGVEAVYTVTEYSLALYTDASQGGEISNVTASNTLSLTQPAPFQIAPGIFSLFISPFSDFVGPGNNFLAGTDIGSPATASFATTTDLSAFSIGLFVFTIVASGTLSGTLGPDIIIDPVITAQGSMVVTYTLRHGRKHTGSGAGELGPARSRSARVGGDPATQEALSGRQAPPPARESIVLMHCQLGQRAAHEQAHPDTKGGLFEHVLRQIKQAGIGGNRRTAKLEHSTVRYLAKTV